MNCDEFNDIIRSYSKCNSEQRFAFAIDLRGQYSNCYFLAISFEFINGLQQLLIVGHDDCRGYTIGDLWR
ncbi:hypothetical protein [Synechococcus phage S-B05]|nr:hypothetical protein [Synechococcus phage S-B05]